MEMIYFFMFKASACVLARIIHDNNNPDQFPRDGLRPYINRLWTEYGNVVDFRKPTAREFQGNRISDTVYSTTVEARLFLARVLRKKFRRSLTKAKTAAPLDITPLTKPDLRLPKFETEWSSIRLCPNRKKERQSCTCLSSTQEGCLGGTSIYLSLDPQHLYSSKCDCNSGVPGK
jgi:hypothetical protein